MGSIDLNMAGAIAQAQGLTEDESGLVSRLLSVWRQKKPRNDLRDRYYLGHVRIKDLGIAMPPELTRRIDPRVDWPRKVVTALADRSVLNGFTADDQATEAELRGLYTGSGMDALYRKCLLGELRHCCGFWTVTTGDEKKRKPIISAYPATAASAVWDDELKAIEAGLVVSESEPMGQTGRRAPSVIEVFTKADVIVLRRNDGGGYWEAERLPHSMGRPLMEPMAYDATLERPFGRSRISRTVMSLTDDAIRQRARMEVAAECATMPQMWLLGTAKQKINEDNRYSAAMAVINEVTKDKDGDSPSIWQSSQLSFQPLVDYYRQLACQMSSESDVPLSFFGVGSDIPSSADAISASLEPLIIDAKNLNRDNGNALRNVAYLALAVMHGTDFATERDAGRNVNPRFMSPAYPSTVSQSDAVLKMVQAIPKLADSDVMLELLEFTDEQMQRINTDAQKAAARNAINSLLAPKKKEASNGGGGDGAQGAAGRA